MKAIQNIGLNKAIVNVDEHSNPRQNASQLLELIINTELVALAVNVLSVVTQVQKAQTNLPP